MDLLIPILAATAATGFAVDLGLDWRRRPRPHAGMWALAIGAYALASWALVLGLAAGWGPVSFRLFYWLGAIVNIPVLAAGSVFLVLGPKTGRRFAYGVGIWSLLGGAATWLAPLNGHSRDRGYSGRQSTLRLHHRSRRGFRPGTSSIRGHSWWRRHLIIVGLAAYSAVRFWRSNRTLAIGNLLIVFGTLAPALGDR